MKPEDFELLSGILKERSGLALTKEKVYLIESRLLPIARQRGLDGLDGLMAALRSNSEEPLLKDITEAMTTNESFFFRDVRPFESFREMLLPALLKAREAKKHIRIWCAACSTGQEPYTLAMCLREEAQKLAGWRTDIIATDISDEVLEKAKAGVYSQFEVQRGLPIQLLVKYFKKAGDMWQIDPAIRGMVRYSQLNLMGDFSKLGAFDIVFCRNVLIYFDQNLKVEVLERIGHLMPSDGFLYLGGAETVIGLTTKFVPMKGQRGVYHLASETAH